MGPNIHPGKNGHYSHGDVSYRYCFMGLLWKTFEQAIMEYLEWENVGNFQFMDQDVIED